MGKTRGPKDDSYDALTEVIDGLDTRQVVTLLCNWFDGHELEKFTAFAREEHGYEDEDESGLTEADYQHLRAELEDMDEEAENSDGGPNVVMTSLGYVYLYPDGTVTQYGQQIADLNN